MNNTLKPVAQPPDKDTLLEVFARVVPTDYSAPLETGGPGGTEDPAYATFRGMAEQWACVAELGTKGVQARFYLPHGLQKDLPASSAQLATATVTISRAGSYDEGLVIVPGAMRLAGPGEREYLNTGTIIWYPGQFDSRVVTFVCEVTGFSGNLDCLANEDGTLDLDLIAIQDQDTDRAAVGGSLTFDSQTILEDSGIPDLFIPSDVGLWVRIDTATDPTIEGQIRRIVSHQWPEVESPPGSGKFPRRVLLDDFIFKNLVAASQEDNSGATFTDFTPEASNDTVNDVPLLPSPVEVDDAFYFAHSKTFGGVDIVISTPGVGDYTVIWEYDNGVSFVPLLDISDPTDGFRPTAAGTFSVRWTISSDWATSTVSGITSFAVRARVSTFTSTTTSPIASRIAALVFFPLVTPATPEIGTVKWTLMDYENKPDALGISIITANAFTDGRDDDLFILGDERGIYRQNNEDDDTFRNRAARLADVVSPNAILRAINRVLSPKGFEGAVCDVMLGDTLGGGFTGLFLDVDASLAPSMMSAFDLYGPGDTFPKNNFFVTQSAQEAYGWFLVKVPFIGEGDFGIFFDEGPLFFDNTVSEYYGPAFTGWMDGEPTIGNACYSAIHNVVTDIKAGGVGFTLVRQESLTIPGVC